MDTASRLLRLLPVSMPSNDATRIPPTGVVHSAKEWERRKPKIRELYMDQQLTLTKTQKLMRRDHKFSATYDLLVVFTQLLSRHGWR